MFSHLLFFTSSDNDTVTLNAQPFKDFKINNSFMLMIRMSLMSSLACILDLLLKCCHSSLKQNPQPFKKKGGGGVMIIYNPLY